MRIWVNHEAMPGAPSGLIERAARHTLEQADIVAGEVSITLLDDERIRDMNRRYLGREYPTDVIAFSLGEGETLGDVYLGFERARDQAREFGVALDVELARLTIHGILHVLGYDHPEGPERVESEMFALQERLLSEVLT